jgi:glucose-6-phosphate dehydrogenase assembly protein OpcA
VSGATPVRPGEILARVDADLRALWAPPAAGETPKARACTMNLVVVATTAVLAEEWLPIIDQVLLGIPARAIVVALDRGGSDSLEADTTAVCTPGEGGGPAVCSERIALVARGAIVGRIPSCVSSLCATDVPTTLVWLGGAAVDDPVFDPLAREASRIVLETGHGTLESLAKTVTWTRARPETDRPGVTDLTWTRLAPWQEMCARMFDEPRLRALALQVGRVTLVQASPTESPLGAEGSMLLGWLATRLAWKPGAAATPRELARGDGGKVELTLVADPDSREPRGALLAVHIQAGTEKVTLRGEIARDAGAADVATWRLEVTSHGGQPQRIEQHVRLHGASTARLLERTLHRPTHDASLADSAVWVRAFGEDLLARR